ncbi:Negative regulator of mitotic exit [Mortierella sp. GBA43]|nr:Negative regulator of mitotic exit [Mortierella sp. GBA43]
MAGLFSKKSKKDKEDKAASKSTASPIATTSASASGISSTGPLASTSSVASSTSNTPSGHKPGSIGSAQAVTIAGTHAQDNSVANNNATGVSTASEYALQQQQQLQQHQQQYGIHGPTKSSFDNDKARVYHLQQPHHQQQQSSSTMVSSSSVSTHNSFVNANGPWISAQVMSLNPFPRFSHTASYVQTGTDIYVFGGVVKGSAQKDMHVVDFHYGGKDAKNKCCDALYVLHTVRKEWNRPMIQGLLPAPRHSHSACVIGTTMYIFGGQFNGYYLNDISAFDMKSLNTPSPKWSRLEPSSESPPARAGHCAAAHDGRVYIFGGADEQFFYNDIWCYDPPSNKWEAVPAFGVLPTSRQGHAASVVDDTMYIFGGMNHEDQVLGDLCAFKFNERRWLTFPETTESPSPRTEHTMCTVADKIYILGGQLELDADDEAGTVFILDTTKIRYHEPSSMGSQRSAYDDDSTLRAEVEPEETSLHLQRPTPSPDSTRQHMNDTHQDTRRTFQQQLPAESKDHYPGQPIVHSPHFTDDPNTGSHTQPRLSLDNSDTIPTSRRRATSKSSAYGVSEAEPRGHSIDETRRPGMMENDYYPNGQRTPQYNNGVHPVNQQQDDIARRRSIESRNRGAAPNQPSTSPPPRASMDQAKTAAAVKQDTSISQHSSKDAEIKELKQREQWLLAEVAVARKQMGEQPLSLTKALKEDMGAFDADQDSEKYRIVQALLGVKAELERSKTAIVTQAQVASNKLREAERVRTAALQEAAYLKAKVSALQSGEVTSLVATETARAVDLEKRLTVALAQVDKLQSQASQHELVLERERHAREAALERERQVSTRAEEAEASHSRSLAELATLHERASKAEANLRECEAKNAASEAGLSSYQQQSSALFSQISTLKTTIDHQKKSLEKAKLAYSVANDRAEHADRLWTQARQEIDDKQLEFASVRADLERAQREADHWKAKAQDTDLLWQKAKSENEAMRALLEDDMNESAYTPGTNSRKHDSIMAITSASRVAELEHELGTLRHLLRDSQMAAAQANKDLGETMVRISQLEQTSMVARADATTAQRQLTLCEDKLASLEAQLSGKEEALEDMAKEQENNEVQLGVLRGVMRENGLLADDLILEALSQSVEGKTPATMVGLKTQVQELEKRALEAESRQEELSALKKQHEERIQQLEADYQTAVHYVQGSETMLQRLRDEAQAAKTERDAIQTQYEELEATHSQCSDLRSSADAAAATLRFEEEVSDLQRQLHEALGRSMELEQKTEEISRALQNSEAASEVTQIELKTLQAKHHEHTIQGATEIEGYQSKLEQLEVSVEETQASLAETKHVLETTQFDLEQARQLNKDVSKELEDALAALKTHQEKTLTLAAPTAEGADQSVEEFKDHTQGLRSSQDDARTNVERQDELQLVIENAQKTIQELQVRNQDLEQQLRASENKISILLDNFQGPDSVRNSTGSMSGSDELILRLLEANPHLSASARSHLTPMSHGSNLTDRSSSDSLANELELLRSNWGQAQLNGTVYRPGAAVGPAGPSTTEATTEAESPAANVTSGTATELVPDESDMETPALTVTGETGRNNSNVKTALAAPSTPGSSQKLEEYEKMIEDMANARRQYEE